MQKSTAPAPKRGERDIKTAAVYVSKTRFLLGAGPHKFSLYHFLPTALDWDWTSGLLQILGTTRLM